MENLATLRALLEMTKEAEAITSDESEIESLRSIVGRIRKIAQKEQKGLGFDQRQRSLTLSRFQLCMMGICEELNFRNTHLLEGVNFKRRLERIREEIERSIKEVESNELKRKTPHRAQ